MPPRSVQIAVVGAVTCGAELTEAARAVGRGLAAAGAVVLTGGRTGVMEAASAGAREAGGTTVGILPGADAASSPPNPHVQLALYTGLGQARNQVLVLSAAAVVAVGGAWGTLVEIALALKHRIPVVTLQSWELRRPDGKDAPLLRRAKTAEEAVELALRAARKDQ